MIPGFDIHIRQYILYLFCKGFLLDRFKKITIRMSSEVLDTAIVEELSTLVEQNPGKTQLFLQIKDADSNETVTLRSKLKGVDVSKDLLYLVENTENMDYVIN